MNACLPSMKKNSHSAAVEKSMPARVRDMRHVKNAIPPQPQRRHHLPRQFVAEPLHRPINGQRIGPAFGFQEEAQHIMPQGGPVPQGEGQHEQAAERRPNHPDRPAAPAQAKDQRRRDGDVLLAAEP